MSKGLKRICMNCGARFYDLDKNPIICPSCSTEFTGEIKVKARRGRVASVKEDILVRKSRENFDDNDDDMMDDDEVIMEDDDEEEEDSTVVSLEDIEDEDDDEDLDDSEDLDLDEIEDLDDIDDIEEDLEEEEEK